MGREINEGYLRDMRIIDFLNNECSYEPWTVGGTSTVDDSGDREETSRLKEVFIC